MAMGSNDKFLRAIGNCLKELRIKKGYTSYENFALDNDIDRKQYWCLESGNNFTLNSLYKILQIHKIKPSDFFKEVEKKIQ